MLRAMLVESIILLTSTLYGREYLRKKQVYRVIQKLHAAEPDEEIKEKCVSVVDMLIRDEAGPEITEVQEEEEDEDLVIEEIA